MSELNRLRELAALFRPKEAVVEDKRGNAPTIHAVITSVEGTLDAFIGDLKHDLDSPGDLESALEAVGLDSKARTELKALRMEVSAFEKQFNEFKKAIMRHLNDIDAMELMATMDAPSKKDVDAIVNKHKTDESLTEMAAAADFMAGWINKRKARELIAAFKEGEETYDLTDGRKFKFSKKLNGGALEAGMVVFAAHDATNTGARVYEVKGFSEGDDRDEVKYKSVKEAYKAHGVTSLRGLEDKEVRMVVKDLEDGDEGGFFYIFEGRWSYGSGAERLSFVQVEKA